MTNVHYIVLVFLVLIHVLLSIIGTNTLRKSTLLSKRQRVYNSILVWLIPLIGFLLVRATHKKTPGSQEEPIKNDVSSRVFHESGAGAPSATIKS